MASVFHFLVLLLFVFCNSAWSSEEGFSGATSTFEIFTNNDVRFHHGYGEVDSVLWRDVNGSFPVSVVNEVSISEGPENKISKIVRLEVLGNPSYLHLPRIFSVSRVNLVLKNSKGRAFTGGLLVKHPHVEACHHRNATMLFGQCSGAWWTFDKKGELTFSTPPFESYYVDLKLPSSGLNGGKVHVHAQEEFQKFRVVFLVLGFLLFSSAHSLSHQVVLYYGVFMMLGTVIVLFMIFRKAMSVLPTGQKGTWYVVFFGSVVGVGSLLWSFMVDKTGELLKYFGLNGDMGFAVALLVLVILICFGAGLGVWFLRKFVLTSEGNVDSLTIRFVTWVLRIMAIVMLSQSSIEPVCILSILVSVILVSSFLNMMPQIFSKLFRLSGRKGGEGVRRRALQRSALAQGGHGDHNPQRLPHFLSPSSFHRIPYHRDREEIESVSYACTQGALQGLYKSPGFNQWVSESFKLTPPRRRQERTFEEIQATAYMPSVDDYEEELEEEVDDGMDDDY